MSSTYQYTGEEGKDELRILASLIDQPDTTPEETVEQINKLTLAPKTYDRQLGDHCYFTAVALLSAAARTSPDRQAKLISFLHKLRSTTVNDPSSGEPLEHEDRIIWSGLPTFGYTFADELNSIPESPNATPEKKQKWENTMAFFAQLDASTEDPELNFSPTWAVAFISAAFKSVQSTEQSEIAVRLACIWFIYDSQKLWNKISTHGAITPEMWQQWKKGLEDVQQSSSEGAKSMVDKALAEIKRAESS